jgi:mannose-6-phosphate isomerase-like protein (cupin superfamily)
MNVKQTIKQLKEKYPGKPIIENKNSKGVTTEIVCELISCTESPETSKAIAVIDQSTSHFHKVLTEIYLITKGKLILLKYDSETKENKKIHLKEGDSIEIKPGEIHSAIGYETWVEVISTPAWTIDDYIPKETIMKKYEAIV